MSKKIKNLIIIIYILAAVLTAVNFVLAQSGADTLLHGGMENQVGNAIGLSAQDPRIIIAKIIRIFIGFLGIIAVGLIMYAGWLWMTSEGNEEQITKAKRVLKNAVIGLIIILLSFGIVTFILNKFLAATGVGGPGPGGGPPAPVTGFGALGACTVESVYPEPNQENVPRNTSIVVTFKEEVKLNTICNDINNDNDCLDPGEYIIPQNVRIYKTIDGDACDPISNPSCTGNVTDVNVIPTPDNKTFVFIMNTWLGSPSQFIWYTVHLTNSIEKLNPANSSLPGIFETCNPGWLEWQFEVSNKVDLTPPQVLNNGIFPPPDNQQDTYSATAATQAQGSVTVISQPQVYAAAAVSSVTNNPPSATWSGATATVDANCSYSGTLQVSVNSGNLTAAQLYDSSGNLLGSGPINGNTATFGFCNLVFTLTSGNFDDAANCASANCLWDVNVTPMVPADTLTVGGTVYTFVSGAPGTNEIQVGATISATAGNIAAALDGRPDLNASVNPAQPNMVDLTAAIAGAAGNNIALSTSNTSALDITPMSGGQDAQTTQNIKDKKDQPKNTIIQINFNEAINPITVSGNADDVWQYIRVVNNAPGALPAGSTCAQNDQCLSYDCSGTCVNDYLAGEFVMSNVYRTVEFVSNDLCGVNGCGEKIYCLPDLSNLKVELFAASLEACAAASDCATKSPYIACGPNSVCQNAAGENYPLSQTPFDGVMDTALNSLDGNRDGDADGPQTQSGQPSFDENSPNPAAQGDDYKWSFWISDTTNLTPPVITSASPAHTGSGVSLVDPVTVDFDKLMMSSSLRTGMTTIFNGKDYIKHKLINIWNFANKPTGYWIAKNDVDSSMPPDGQPDYTQALINHSMFYDSTSYRTQVGSGVKDIYQNCYKPSEGPGCTTAPGQESCCPVGASINPTTVTPGDDCP
jgi:hypothetical protein